uniref:Uncharacterized protein n=1 Tax=Romanomermis culicivorax TaxID=13658 RepID=A0A915IT74_ROMCU
MLVSFREKIFSNAPTKRSPKL